MATKLEKMARELNGRFTDELDAAFQVKFGVTLETTWNIFSMQLVSLREDGEDMTPEQHAFVTGYSQGYGKALEMVRERDMERHFSKDAA